MEEVRSSVIALVGALERNRGITEDILTKFFTDDLFAKHVTRSLTACSASLSSWDLLTLPLHGELLSLPNWKSLYFSMPLCLWKENDSLSSSDDAMDRTTCKWTGVSGISTCDLHRILNNHIQRVACSVCTSVQRDRKVIEKDNLRENTFVGVKKKHEVEELATTIIGVAESLGIRNIVDVGSGRGILGHFLAEQHGFHVLGIESSNIAISGGNKRLHMVYKCSRKQPPLGLTSEIGPDKACEENAESTDLDNLKARGFRGTEGYISRQASHSSSEITTKKMELLTYASSGSLNTINCTLTASKESQLHLMSLISAHRDFGEKGYVLVGLHACGDLTSNILRIYASDPKALALCVVGCCYNLLTDTQEEKVANSYAGFPLSSEVRSHGFSLSRAAGHLACQCPIKMAMDKRLPGLSLLYRAIFEVILRKLDWTSKDENRLPRLKRMYKDGIDFVSYTRASYLKLTGTDIPISDAAITEFYEKYLSKWEELQVYNQVHASLAPYLECLILLDRLAYLYEQNYYSSDIVQVFCPLKSPRCCALVSTKSSLNTVVKNMKA